MMTPETPGDPDSVPTAAEDTSAQLTASRSARVLAYWRWGKIRELLQAAGQLALFDETEPDEQSPLP